MLFLYLLEPAFLGKQFSLSQYKQQTPYGVMKANNLKKIVNLLPKTAEANLS